METLKTMETETDNAIAIVNAIVAIAQRVNAKDSDADHEKQLCGSISCLIEDLRKELNYLKIDIENSMGTLGTIFNMLK